MPVRLRIFPSRRRLLVLLALAALPVFAWLLWSPGADIRDGRHDLQTNAIWMQRGWLADDAWLARNGKSPEAFRDPSRIATAAMLLQTHHIRFVYPHLCPCRSDGALALSDPTQVERFLDGFAGFDVFPWVGGARGETARIADPAWRSGFAQACAAMVRQHPRLGGVHVNIETIPSGDADFLAVLEAVRHALPAGKRLSVAAYPPRTRWQPTMEVHWDETYAGAVAARVDQVVVMMYDTGLHSSKLYEQLMKNWTREVLAWYAPDQVLLGVPAYDDAGVEYHDPATENLAHGLAGVHAGLAPMPGNYAGVAIYSEWQMTPEKWKIYEERFQRAGP